MKSIMFALLSAAIGGMFVVALDNSEGYEERQRARCVEAYDQDTCDRMATQRALGLVVFPPTPTPDTHGLHVEGASR